MLSTIPEIGWYVLAGISLLIFLLIWFKGATFKHGNTAIALATTHKIDKRIAQSRETERHDDAERIRLFRLTNEIDAKAKADYRRIVRALTAEVYDSFSQWTKCEFPITRIVSIIKGELFQRIDENNLRERLCPSEAAGYLYDIVSAVKVQYKIFLSTIQMQRLCDESYPEWEEIQDDITRIIMYWQSQTKAALIFRIKEKIELYDQNKNVFTSDEFKESSIVKPKEKNQNYIKLLTTSVEEKKE